MIFILTGLHSVDAEKLCAADNAEMDAARTTVGWLTRYEKNKKKSSEKHPARKNCSLPIKNSYNMRSICENRACSRANPEYTFWD